MQRAAAAAVALCVAILLLLLMQEQRCCFLLLFVTLCWMAKFCWFIHSDPPVFSFSSFKRDLSKTCPLAVLCRISGLSLPTSTSSVITGMRGAKAGVILPRRTSPCIFYYLIRSSRPQGLISRTPGICVDICNLLFMQKRQFVRVITTNKASCEYTRVIHTPYLEYTKTRLLNTLLSCGTL